MPQPETKKVYMIGIKGVGMTMLAQFLKASGCQVSGSDIIDTFLTDQVLRQEKIKVLSPFAVKNIPHDADLIIYSSAFDPKNNPEMAALKNQALKNIKAIPYAEALGGLFNNYRGLAVCGSHGKTTTSAWLGYVLDRSGLSPNVLVGSRVPQFKGSTLKGRSRYFVAEVDEYQNKLKFFNPYGVILNNIEFDHPDFFKDQKAYTKVFADFLKKIPRLGFLIISNRDPEIRKIKKYCRGTVISYDVAGHGNGGGKPTYLASSVHLSRAYQIFSVKGLGDFKISLWGEHNILNALAVIATARELKVPLAKIKKHLAGFKGTERRAQVLGQCKGAWIIDDYAHHPTEVKATIAGIRSRFPNKKLLAVFHPHTFTRTQALFKEFVSSFTLLDELIVLDIYGSAREKQGGVSSQRLVQEIKKYHRLNKFSSKIKYIPTINRAASYMKGNLDADKVLLLLGAGDVFRLGQTLLKK